MSRNTSDTQNMALFCDFENVALGVKDARYEHFDIGKILERLLLKGSIVVKKAYCDWERYKDFKSSMHQASFEMIEIPHLRMSGKNSADIRMVVDALDLCYTKAHVDTFVIISGDSDFSPLVSKLRENNKTVIGVGVKNSTSDLLIANCDEFIFYDDLVREQRRRSSVAAKSRAPARRRVEGAEKIDRTEKTDRTDRTDRTDKSDRTDADRTDKAEKSAGGRGESNGRSDSGGRPGRGGRNERRERGTAALVGGGPAGQEIMFSEEGVPPATGLEPLAGPPGASPVVLQEGSQDQPEDPSQRASQVETRTDPFDSTAYEPLTSEELMAEPLGLGGSDTAGLTSGDREERILHGLDLVVETLEALLAERGEDERIWGSMIKQTLKRRNPGFNEIYYGFKSFNKMLEEAQDRNLIKLENDDKSGGYIVRAV